MITVKVWQLMLGGLALVLVLGFMATKVMGGSSVPAAPAVPAATPAQHAQAATLNGLVPALEAWRAKHKTYKGFHNAGVTLVSGTPTTYCVESAGAFPHVFKHGPAARPMFGTFHAPSAGRPLS